MWVYEREKYLVFGGCLWPERYSERLGRKQIKSHIHIFSQNDMKFSSLHNDDSQSFSISKLNFDNKFYLQNLTNFLIMNYSNGSIFSIKNIFDEL